MTARTCRDLLDMVEQAEKSTSSNFELRLMTGTRRSSVKECVRKVNEYQDVGSEPNDRICLNNKLKVQE